MQRKGYIMAKVKVPNANKFKNVVDFDYWIQKFLEMPQKELAIFMVASGTLNEYQIDEYPYASLVRDNEPEVVHQYSIMMQKLPAVAFQTLRVIADGQLNMNMRSNHFLIKKVDDNKVLEGESSAGAKKLGAPKKSTTTSDGEVVEIIEPVDDKPITRDNFTSMFKGLKELPKVDDEERERFKSIQADREVATNAPSQATELEDWMVADD